MWYKLKVGIWDLKYSPIKPDEVSYPDCDKDGNVLKRITEGKRTTYFVNEQTGERHEKAFKLIKGNARDKLLKTKEVQDYKEVDKTEAEDLIVQEECVVYCDPLLRDLQDTGKALKFGFSNGNGHKAYLTYIVTNPLYPTLLFMKMGRTQKSEKIQAKIDELKLKEKSKEVLVSIQGIDRARVEDLIEL